jgi:hypothetical protein
MDYQAVHQREHEKVHNKTFLTRIHYSGVTVAKKLHQVSAHQGDVSRHSLLLAK